mmetsp:Transcript_52006/g.96265  ORF Transcript_52006/g.96265 Transcript_52006/m.96265 type:complete len:221 (-) Transcript_52006:191-853(-)
MSMIASIGRAKAMEASVGSKVHNSCFRAQMKKTTLCRYYAKGKCALGAECNFAHSLDELQRAPDLSKTRLCEAWLAGQCPLESYLCPFAHGKQDRRRTPAFQGRKGNNRGPASDSSSAMCSTVASGQGSEYSDSSASTTEWPHDSIMYLEEPSRIAYFGMPQVEVPSTLEPAFTSIEDAWCTSRLSQACVESYPPPGLHHTYSPPTTSWSDGLCVRVEHL